MARADVFKRHSRFLYFNRIEVYMMYQTEIHPTAVIYFNADKFWKYDVSVDVNDRMALTSNYYIGML